MILDGEWIPGQWSWGRARRRIWRGSSSLWPLAAPPAGSCRVSASAPPWPSRRRMRWWWSEPSTRRACRGVKEYRPFFILKEWWLMKMILADLRPQTGTLLKTGRPAKKRQSHTANGFGGLSYHQGINILWNLSTHRLYFSKYVVSWLLLGRPGKNILNLYLSLNSI